jgi:hypothetical protein
MARIRVTSANIQARLSDWAASATNRGDELIILPADVDWKDAQIKSFNSNAKMVIKVEPDVTDPFYKITFVEILA